MQVAHADSGLICPLHKKDMADVCHKCPLWILIRGKTAQGEEIDQWRCSLAVVPMLLIENANQMREMGAAIESFRNAAVGPRDQRLISKPV